MSSTPAIRFAAVSAVRNAAHFLADYWVQSDHQAVTKGKPGAEGARACAAHVLSYSLTSAAAVALANRVLRLGLSTRGVLAGELISALTHYAADRREHGLLFPAARHLGKGGFLDRGGAPLLDQAWHHVANAFVAGVTALDTRAGCHPDASA